MSKDKKTKAPKELDDAALDKASGGGPHVKVFDGVSQPADLKFTPTTPTTTTTRTG